MNETILDTLISHGIREPKASDLAALSGMSVELIEDAFRREPNDSPIAIASNLVERAGAIARLRERLNNRDEHEQVEYERKRRANNAEISQVGASISDDLAAIDAIDPERLSQHILAIKTVHPWIESDDPRDSNFLRALVLEREGSGKV